MIPAQSLQIKICCIQSIAEARLVLRLGATALGLVSQMPSGPGPIEEKLIAEIVKGVPPDTNTFLLTRLTDPSVIIGQHRRCKTKTIQFCDRLDPSAYPVLRTALPNVIFVQVIHVEGSQSLAQAMRVSHSVDILLLDSGRPNAPLKELGGTGRTHDWSISARIVKEASVPVLLAGGLTPENVALAYRTVKPAGVDVCSGVRLDGRLEEMRVERFIQAVKTEASLISHR